MDKYLEAMEFSRRVYESLKEKYPERESVWKTAYKREVDGICLVAMYDTSISAEEHFELLAKKGAITDDII